MEHSHNINVISLFFFKNRKALYIQYYHGNDLQVFRNFGMLKLASFLAVDIFQITNI